MLATDAVIRYTLSTNTCVPVLLSVILYMKNIQAKKTEKNYCLKIVLKDILVIGQTSCAHLFNLTLFYESVICMNL